MSLKLPLFVTRFSLSSRSAIGVQTKLFTDVHAEWFHFHWWCSELRRQDQRSIRLENLPQARWSLLRTPGRLPLPGVGILNSTSWWRENRLRPDIEAQIRRQYRDRISVAYLAPLGAEDAARMRCLIEILEVPFVLHLWDLLDGPPDNEINQDLRWLLKRAERVFCLSDPMLNDLKGLRPDAAKLIFSRKAATASAVPPTGNELKIMLVGDIASYSEGLEILNDAVERLLRDGTNVKLQYVGPNRMLTRVESRLVDKIQRTNFTQSTQQRDKIIASAHVGFLPGPSLPPSHDWRSRYSIPSRFLDFLALGLPVAGAVHPASATAGLHNSICSNDLMLSTDPPILAESLKSLLDHSTWMAHSAGSKRAFASLSNDSQPAKLKTAMEEVSTSILSPSH